MPVRYTIRPKAWEYDYDWETGQHRTMTVFQPESVNQNTGLLDVNGNPIYRHEEMEPIGFVRFEEGTLD